MMEARGVSAPASTPPRDTWFWILLAGVCVLAVAAACFNGGSYVQAAWLGTALNFYSALAFAATSALLYSTLRVDGRRAIVILAATFLGTSVLAAFTTDGRDKTVELR